MGHRRRFILRTIFVIFFLCTLYALIRHFTKRHPDIAMIPLSKVFDINTNWTREANDFIEIDTISVVHDIHPGQFYDIKGTTGDYKNSDITSFYNVYRTVCQSGQKLKEKKAMPYCACLPQTLERKVFEKKPKIEESQFQEIINRTIVDVYHGGWWKPSSCVPRWSLAVIVPFRNREMHLNIFLKYIHPFLQRQQLEYRVFIVEQVEGTLFNRAGLLNIGYLESLKTKQKFDCIVFHDVDIIPEDGRSMYTCQFAPLHIAAYLSKNGYNLLYPRYFGGVTIMRPEHIEAVNGHSNRYFGWGGEDDDLINRIQVLIPDASIFRYPQSVSRTYMISHKLDEGNEVGELRRQGQSVHTPEDYRSDGLNTANYTVLSRKELPLCTWIKVQLEKPSSHGQCHDHGIDCWSPESLLNGQQDCCRSTTTPRCCNIPRTRYKGKPPSIQLYEVV